MKIARVMKAAHRLARRYRIDDGRHFRLTDVDPDALRAGSLGAAATPPSWITTICGAPTVACPSVEKAKRRALAAVREQLRAER
ncbi:MAG TPA: hypothetical protein VNO26_07865 [Candidatus Limnocylindria bacterium]|nr:hypothetical protein [Candidatus Limnocylindria bacterium]